MTKTTNFRTYVMTDIHGNACCKPAHRAFRLAVAVDSKDKELAFWCSDLPYEAFKARFLRGQLKKVTFDTQGLPLPEK